jgi:hypothetical protein
MHPRGGSRGTRVDPDTVSVHEGEGSSSELSASIAIIASLPPVKTTMGEEARKKREERRQKYKKRRMRKEGRAAKAR